MEEERVYNITFKALKSICRLGKPSCEGFACRTKNNKSFTDRVSWGECDEENCPLIHKEQEMNKEGDN